jgi:hypothetical protein
VTRGTSKWPTVAGNGRRNTDERLALEVAAGKAIREAAQVEGIGERAVYRRRGTSPPGPGPARSLKVVTQEGASEQISITSADARKPRPLKVCLSRQDSASSKELKSSDRGDSRADQR